MGTLVLVTTMWFGLLTGRTAPLMAAVIIGVGIVFAMYAVAGFSGQDDPFTAGFKGSLYAMVVGIGLLIAYRTTGNASFVLVAPVVAAGVGGSVALAPSNVRSQMRPRASSAWGSPSAGTSSVS